MQLTKIRRTSLIAAASGLIALVTMANGAMAATQTAQTALGKPDPATRSVRTSAGILAVAKDGTVTLNGRKTGNINALKTAKSQALSISNVTTFSAARPGNPTGWDTSWNNVESNCAARANVTFQASTAPTDPLYTHTSLNATVSNPYLFTGCRLNAAVKINTALGVTFVQPSRTLLACSTWDPTCPNWASRNWEIDNETPDLAATTNLLRILGQPVTVGMLVSTVELNFSRA